ncbi:MAG: hypothetical protein COX29_04445 [Candidatus Moranbacteria bacterium CG23_combo_of_CG06-09_8_20_14_all_35_22]|nr:MAG: hypothetical protein COX29_04445 [Candidatus Moranbacteria bacterium CG23_combo_of_CG06-09_8_20_14_all_35_22]
MKKIISKIFVRIIAISLVLLSFKKNAFAQLELNSDITQLPGEASSLDMGINFFAWLTIFFLFPLSLLLAIIFYIKYFLIRKKIDELSNIKTQKFLKRGKIFLIISILLITLYIIIGIVDNYMTNHSEIWY